MAGDQGACQSQDEWSQHNSVSIQEHKDRLLQPHVWLHGHQQLWHGAQAELTLPSTALTSQDQETELGDASGLLFFNLVVTAIAD